MAELEAPAPLSVPVEVAEPDPDAPDEAALERIDAPDALEVETASEAWLACDRCVGILLAPTCAVLSTV